MQQPDVDDADSSRYSSSDNDGNEAHADQDGAEASEADMAASDRTDPELDFLETEAAPDGPVEDFAQCLHSLAACWYPLGLNVLLFRQGAGGVLLVW